MVQCLIGNIAIKGEIDEEKKFYIFKCHSLQELILENIEFGINQIRRRFNFTYIYHNNHHIKLLLHGSFILTSFQQHSPRCNLQLINFKISSFLSSPLLFFLTSLSLLFVFLAIFCPPLERTKIPLREIAQ